tara:strand:- start:959 stop:1558 length:600 start_codon:yes stop_codon:yes gene_type:complete
VDTDSYGIGNNADTDDDGDGVNDTSDAFSLDSTETVDTDGDGVGNNADTDDYDVNDTSDAFPLDSTESVDTDGDRLGDNEEVSVGSDHNNTPNTKAQLELMLANYYEANTPEACKNINNWNTNQITDINKLFHEKTLFNCDISNWDVTNVTDMTQMFHSANTFNQDLSNWKVSSVTSCDLFSQYSGLDNAYLPNFTNCP